MTARQRVLTLDDVRRELAARAFAPPLDAPLAAGSFAVETELHLACWTEGPGRAYVPGIESEAPDGAPVFAALTEVARDLDWALVPPHEQDFEADAPRSKPQLRILPGRRLGVRTGAHATPADAGAELERALDALRRALAQQGVAVLGVGAQPFVAVDELMLANPCTTERCLAAALESSSPEFARAHRATCGTTVRIGFGGPFRLAMRWRAAQLLAPIATATFACSPLADGAHAGVQSVRGRARRMAEPGRCGFPSRLGEELGADPCDVYLDFALAARVAIIRLQERWIPVKRPVAFSHWMEHGFSGEWPELDDLRFHLHTLAPEVRPAGLLELASADALPRAFATVPLVWWSALLCDDGALAAVLELLAPSANDLDGRWERAAQDGLRDGDLARDARELYSLAAGALMHFDRGFVSPSMLASFIAFGQRFAQRGRSPADDLLDAFLAHSGLGRAEWNDLDRAWCETLSSV